MPISQDQFRAIISGQRRDAWATVIRTLLGAASLGYRLVVCIRNKLYDCGALRSCRVGVPVVCVGNLTTGGTGKTPLVTWITRFFQQRGLRVAILTRGYKSGAGALSDEPAELASACPSIPVIINGDRVGGAGEAISTHDAQVLVMDDGFQHRRLVRDLDIVTVDATEPFGYSRLLPAGLLREPLTGLRRAGAIVLTRCDQVSIIELDAIEGRLLAINASLVIARSVHAPVAAQCLDGTTVDPAELRGKKVFAFCGLGNPQSFLRTIERHGCTLTGSRVFNDHHAYTKDCVAEIYHAAEESGAEFVLTTEKDRTKLAGLSVPHGPLSVVSLAVEIRFITGDEPLTALLERAAAGKMAPS
jgi:tetraacyldisaccharide 4'-kinase